MIFGVRVALSPIAIEIFMDLSETKDELKEAI